MDSANQKLVALLDELSKADQLPRLSAAARDVDRIIEQLSDAREQIAQGKLSQVCPPGDDLLTSP